MDKISLAETTIHKAAQSLREDSIKRLNEGIVTPSDNINLTSPKSLAHRLQSKRSEALVTSIFLISVLGLSVFFHPVDWRFAFGCLSAGIVMALSALLDRKGHVYFAGIAFLVAIGLFLFSAVKFGAVGAMLWIQGVSLTGIGAFGTTYFLFDKFDFKEWDFMVRPKNF